MKFDLKIDYQRYERVLLGLEECDAEGKKHDQQTINGLNEGRPGGVLA